MIERSKREEFVYVDLMSSIKQGFDNLNNKIDGIDHDSFGDMSKKVYDKNEDHIVDIAETLVGLGASIEELNSLIGIQSNIQEQIDQLNQRKPKMIKTIYTICAEKDQSEFVFDRNIENGVIVELRSNSIWIHDEDYTISDNKVILKNPFPVEKQIDFIFYESTF